MGVVVVRGFFPTAFGVNDASCFRPRHIEYRVRNGQGANR